MAHIWLFFPWHSIGLFCIAFHILSLHVVLFFLFWIAYVEKSYQWCGVVVVGYENNFLFGSCEDWFLRYSFCWANATVKFVSFLGWKYDFNAWFLWYSFHLYLILAHWYIPFSKEKRGFRNSYTRAYCWCFEAYVYFHHIKVELCYWCYFDHSFRSDIRQTYSFLENNSFPTWLNLDWMSSLTISFFATLKDSLVFHFGLLYEVFFFFFV